MKTITIGFSHANNLFSKIIMWITKSNISHTYIKLDNGDIFQASGLMVNEMTSECFLSIETVIKEFQIQLTDEQYAWSEAFRISSLGKPYSIWEILGFGWVLLMRRFGRNVSNPFKDGTKAYVCVKLVADYAWLSDSGENLTPIDLYNLLNSSSN